MMTDTRTLADRCRAVEWLVLDVDGVLTAGGIEYGSISGEVTTELKAFHVRDGSALRLWRLQGKHAAIITGRTSPIVAVRADELGVRRVVQGASDKAVAFARLAAEAGIDPQSACYVGDDLPDVPVLGRVALAAVPADACPEAKAAAHYVCGSPGGAGAVREVIERILRCQGRWGLDAPPG